MNKRVTEIETCEPWLRNLFSQCNLTFESQDIKKKMRILEPSQSSCSFSKETLDKLEPILSRQALKIDCADLPYQLSYERDPSTKENIFGSKIQKYRIQSLFLVHLELRRKKSYV